MRITRGTRDLNNTRDTEERRDKHERQERLQDRDLRDETDKKDLRDTPDKRGLRVTKHAARERGNLQKPHKRANHLKRQHKLQQTAHHPKNIFDFQKSR